ncbi:MAG: hypothetical protein FMNOHCHN_01070 [Ignavibacteriaceae bacterium]|nr:hypothetical protein [Ignavibacteriaceae bacterium]
MHSIKELSQNRTIKLAVPQKKRGWIDILFNTLLIISLKFKLLFTIRVNQLFLEVLAVKDSSFFRVLSFL